MIFPLKIMEYRLLLSEICNKTLFVGMKRGLATLGYLYYHYQKFAGKKINLYVSSFIDWTNILVLDIDDVTMNKQIYLPSF